MERKLHKIDATDKAPGRIASDIAILLRGKNKPEFQPHIDAGDIVEVYNIDKLKFTGKKLEQKNYYSYSGYPGGLKTRKMSDINDKKPGEILKRAVREMLPPVKFRTDMLKRLIIR
ncbi:MAG: 50S ribosomal protein L13 [Candidatus Falkowbacteria bacterium GW2011_GWC2_38_22]|uniref:Large ribosomal subunit protein uL13 n=1 Tax=Candidatus Falkowbacteria bacterium GW2011_GWE1_38_31 TaxID=1618638 RepID=A0A0G0K2Q6_9BACT|nr:MAG: 50S ribosomal protein L13 [Candidatus Falkowbacteria bacterium GW2011_GWF2_38_1205]KKQ60782.1 MAG: 50S ribosomal protein L13 [Candidatus Falkowbacteria bacterium GW2011_GWC2_38_22]KKQ62949.1 MAG: 50S ribosomal protein L13 [Candidatus Falkowbacteria bacterium GW2011_GWF1_38_22]KKQ64961.1 MAG: 50S ribosomal protein L13 [Candidatus Falkowbacteria bacterium GW2011_GWE2_38_254]KKQ69725.1 MAG: 50S ribosomal protein L13 [Candidatus Falkowbacteria bacterium GW2011_GWE1_38_31]KKQ72333.1 MAG: 50